MRKTILIILSFISINCFCQTQTEFYIENVKYIKYITLNFCVDNEGKTSAVTIIPEKTTINDSTFQSKIIEYRKSIQYYPDTKLKNNCYDQIFTFIDKELESCSISDNDFLKLDIIKTGTYKYENPNYKNTVITRTENLQVEETNGVVYKYKIEWPKPNQYILTYLEVGEKENEYLIGEKIYVDIVKQIDSKTYAYKSKLLDRDIVTGIISKFD